MPTSKLEHIPKWLRRLKGEEVESTRSRSRKQEKKIAKDLGGRTTINSGATFKQNDIHTKNFEVEAKTTKKKSFTIVLSYWNEIEKKCDYKKVPIMVVQFEGEDKQLAVIDYEALKQML